MTGYVFHPEAFADLDQIWDYIAEYNVEAADRVIAQIFDTLQTLVSSPYIGHQRADLASRPIRFISVLDYLVAYAPDQSPLWVIAVIHGHRNPRVIAAALRGRGEQDRLEPPGGP